MWYVVFDWGGVFMVGIFDGCSIQNVVECSGVFVEKVCESYFWYIWQFEVGVWILLQFWEMVQQEIGMMLFYVDFEVLYFGSIYDNVLMYIIFVVFFCSVWVGLLSNNYFVVSEYLGCDLCFVCFDVLVFFNEIGYKKFVFEVFVVFEQKMGLFVVQVVFVDDVQENIDVVGVFGFYGIFYYYDVYEWFEQELKEWFWG